MKTRLLSLLGLFVFCACAQEIGYVEEFALAKDRAKPLAELIPGTPDYYYYHCLDAQNTGDLGQADKMLAEWIKKHGRGGRVEQMLNRQALLKYPEDPQGALRRIREQLGINLNHTRRERQRETSYPTVLDPKLVSREALDRNARRHRLLSGFKPQAYRRLAETELDPDRRRALLGGLKYPDVPNLAKLVVADLKHKHSRGFGSLGIHNQMFLSQLDECARAMPELRNHGKFITAYLKRLAPNVDVDTREPTVRQAYLDRVWTFVETLPPSQNSLKALVLFQRLQFDRSQGVRDRARFLAYIQLPRQVWYVRREYLKRREFRGYFANLNQQSGGLIEMPPIRNDEPLVREYLQHFLLDAADFAPFASYFEESYLKEVFAEIKILHGIGDQEKWYAYLAPEKVRALRDRVELEFLPTNQNRFLVPDKVTLSLAVKNVRSLIVKVYEINTPSFYRQRNAEITTAVDLDGLAPNEERVLEYKQPALRRHVETFEFSQLSRPGVWVVEFIGNGRSSRALIRKGDLRHFLRSGSAGYVFHVFDEASRRVTDAALVLGGRRFEADERGEIVVPYSTKGGNVPFVLEHRGFAVRRSFAQGTEQYALDVSFHMDRESLLARNRAKLLVRARLLLGQVPVDIALLKNVFLDITGTDGEGIESTQSISVKELRPDREYVHEMRVPQNLRNLSFVLRGEVEMLTTGKKVPLHAVKDVELNGVDRTDFPAMFHLRPTAKGFVLEMLGKTGEPIAGRPVNLEGDHPDYARPFRTRLQTADNGRIQLGTLAGFERIYVQAEGVAPAQFTLPAREERHALPGTLHAVVGETITVVPDWLTPESLAADASLCELRGPSHGSQVFVADRRSHLRLQDDQLQIVGLPAGAFQLDLRQDGRPVGRIPIHVTKGRRDRAALLGVVRALEPTKLRPLGIRSVSRQDKTVRVRLANAGADTRVHVFVERFAGLDTPFLGLVRHLPTHAGALGFVPRRSLYLSGRDIGDEYRYILERRRTTARPGNLLRKPSLILNPWSLGKTRTGKQEAREGKAWNAVAEKQAGRRISGVRTRAASFDGGGGSDSIGGGNITPAYDFLSGPSLLFANLKPDADGVVVIEIDADQLGPRQFLRVVAVDRDETVARDLHLPLLDETFKDLRLARSLPADEHFAERKLAEVVPAGKAFGVEDVRSSKVQTYDTLGKVFGLLRTLCPDQRLAEFEFLTRWDRLEPAAKRERFGKYACHELAFFVHQKDPAFFADVVKPYLANKRDKTFLDHWLLDADLTPYLTPWAYGRLNIFEQVLLARRLPAESAATKRHVQDLHDLIPPDAARFDHLFKTALGGSALEAEGELAEMDDVLDEELAAAPAKNERARKSIAAKPGAAAPPRPQVIMASGKDAKRGMAKKSKKFMIEVEKEVMEDALLSVAGDSDKNAESKRDMKRRAKMRQFFRSPDTTEEWAETNYYHVPIEKHLAALVTVNAFWRDFAAHTGEGPFLSANVAEASRSLTEVLLALGALALPFEAKPAAPVFDGPSMTIKPQSPLLVFHRQTRPSKLDAEGTKILIGQNFFDIADRYRHDGNRRLDKFVTAEFLAGRVYGCQIVVTNPTSTPREIDVLLQIPRGAMPVANGFYTRGVHLALGSYSTETYEYRFYFPQAGSFPQFPAHVGERGVLVASAAPFPFNVVGMLTKIDREAWEYVSQYSSVYEVIEFLQKHNIDRLNLDLIAFRMKERAFFGRVLGLLRTRRVYSPTLWSYGVMHNDAQALREFLPHTPFADQCGMALASPLLTLDPVARHRWQLKEYWPLINARAHRLGGKRTIMNRQFLAQYQSFLRWLAHKPALGNEDRLALVVYLLLQDRVEEALAEFADIKRGKQDARLQYDYLKAYLAFCQSDPKTARKVAKPHREHPVPRWRNLFGDILAQCDEIQGAAATVAADPEDRERRQNALADTEPTFDFEIEEREIRMTCRNLEALTVNYYRMDLELLFSRTPFVRDVSGQFAIIQPNRSDELKLKKSATRQEIPLPKEFRQANTMVEITAAGRAVSRAYYPHAMDVQLVETYGRLRIAGKDGGKPIPAAYVKVYTRRKDGTVKFYKDGYTDLRGRFDYASLSTSDLDHVERFSILILSRDNGSVVREAAPPKR